MTLRAEEEKTENLDFSFEGGEIRVQGDPDAVKLISLSDPKSKRISGLGLHKSDLEHCSDCLMAIPELTGPGERSELLANVLWDQAVVYFVKCFSGSASRFQLDFVKIFGKEPGARLAFEYFKNLRNKHLIHDENSLAQSLTGAIVNSSSSEKKVAKIVNSVVKSQTLEQGHYTNLRLLVSKAYDWVVAQLDELCDQVTKDLEDKTYDDLLKFPVLSFKVPEARDLENNR